MRQFNKAVRIKATDDDERTATGLVLRSNELDTQLDFFDGQGIRNVHNPDPDTGVLHAVFPEEDVDVEMNRVLDEPETIDGADFEADDWVIRAKYNDDDLWQLVKDGVFSGFSVGGMVTESTRYNSIDDLPDDVTIPDRVDPYDDAVQDQYWPPERIDDGEFEEVSTVDIPAVPAAEMAVVKSMGAESVKKALDEAGNVDEFVEFMRDRGHEESDARRVWQYLQSAKLDGSTCMDKDVDKSAPEWDPDADAETKLQALKSLLFGGSDDGAAPEAPDAISKAVDIIKAGRKLNETNVRALMAAHDTIESVLSSEVEFSTNRFTDNPMVDFDVESYSGKIDMENTELNGRVESLEEKVDGIAEKVDEIADGADDETEDGQDDEQEEKADELEEAVDSLESKVDDIADRLDKVAASSADTQQGGDVGSDDGSEKRKAIELEREVFG